MDKAHLTPLKIFGEGSEDNYVTQCLSWPVAEVSKLRSISSGRALESSATEPSPRLEGFPRFGKHNDGGTPL